ncbi:hypothetical protein EI94DRAFT_1722617 [Lactarius quietus]|nr:hypothetical protein EI94DRAFT_1722617 [Lactarius quietus]
MSLSFLTLILPTSSLFDSIPLVASSTDIGLASDVPRCVKIHYQTDTSRPLPTSKQLSDPRGPSFPFHPTTICSFQTPSVPFTLSRLSSCPWSMTC